VSVAGATADLAGVTVSGAGVARGAPSLARARFGASVARPRLAESLAETDATVVRLREALERFGVAREDAVTGWLTVQEIQYEGVYRCSHTIDATLRDLSRVGEVLGGVLLAGGDGATLSGVEFDVADRGPLHTEARARAWADAHEKAQQLAAHAGRRLGAVQGVAEVEPTYRPLGGVRTMALAESAASGGAELDVEPGRVAVEVSLTATWSFA
jgi:uncharacterized protein YggE